MHLIEDSNFYLEINHCWFDSSIITLSISLTLLLFNLLSNQSIKFHKTNQNVISSQIYMDKPESLGHDFLDVIVENGYVTLFSGSNPLVFFVMLYNMQITMNKDLEKLFSMTQRCIPYLAKDIGIFE